MATFISHSSPGSYPTYTYNVYFFSDTIFTTVTSDPAVVTQWITEVRFINSGAPRNIVAGLDITLRLGLGLDISLRLPLSHGRVRTATLQLCIGNRCLIYQLIHTPYLPRALDEFLNDKKFVFVGVSIGSNVQRLRNDYRIVGGPTVDLGLLAAQSYGRDELGNGGPKALASLVLGIEMDRPEPVRLSEWGQWRLTAEQVQFACVDAFVSMQIGKTLLNL